MSIKKTPHPAVAAGRDAATKPASTTKKPEVKAPTVNRLKSRSNLKPRAGYSLDKFVRVGAAAMPAPVKDHQLALKKKASPQKPSIAAQLGLSFQGESNAKTLHMPGWLDTNIEHAIGF